MTYLDFFPGPGAYDLDLFPNEARGDGAEKVSLLLRLHCPRIFLYKETHSLFVCLSCILFQLWEVFGAIHPSRIESIRGQQSVSELRAYLSALRRYNQPSLFQSEADVFGAHPMRHYPGSPLLAHYFLRPQDNAVFVDDDEQSLSQVTASHPIRPHRLSITWNCITSNSLFLSLFPQSFSSSTAAISHRQR